MKPGDLVRLTEKYCSWDAGTEFDVMARRMDRLHALGNGQVPVVRALRETDGRGVGDAGGPSSAGRNEPEG